ncbi:MAG: hypothetical protein LQ337_005125 [Flavoplaca oasis]|nr:MAG: hypothetical protein LQ337_005125 [Flavoplaca oasis]
MESVLTEPTATVSSTSYLTSTKIVAVDHQSDAESAQPSSLTDGPYSFAEENGSTVWLGGKTPASGAALVTNTLVVTLQPQPSSTETISLTTSSGTTVTAEDDTTTSWTTLSSTSFYTHYLTNVVSTPKLSAYLGNNGWNATATTLHALSSSGHETAPTSIAARRVHPRQVGALVTATINGVVVTWTNVWAGDPVKTESSALSTIQSYMNRALEVHAVRAIECPLTTSLNGRGEGDLTDLWYVAPEPPVVPSYTWNANPEIAVSTTMLSVEPTPTFANASQTSPGISTPESTCGADTGRFTIDFDDLPQFSPDASTTDVPPIFNPYRKLYFNGGFGYVPPPDDPFAPISPPQLAVYNYYNDPTSSQSVNAGLQLRGELGAGPRVLDNAYWIDAHSAWVGCANGGPTDCRIELIGLDAFDTAIATQRLLQPPCPGLVDCTLAQITFSEDFRNLAGLQILAYVDETPVTFYMDDLSLGWSNNTCEAQIERSSSS